MKRFLKIFFGIIILIIVILFTAPFVFKGKIIKIAKQQVNENVNAKVDFKNLNLSFFRNFPNLSVTIKDLTVTGIDQFENDTLVSFESFRVAVNAISAIKGENIDIKKIELKKIKMFAHVLEDGSVNWDIVKETEEEEKFVEEDTVSGGMDMSISLRKFEITDATIAYVDDSSDMSAIIKDWDFKLKGDFSLDFCELDVLSDIQSLTFRMGGINYLNNAGVFFKALIDANLKDNIYILKDNEFGLNNLLLGFDGNFELKEETTNINLEFKTKKADLKSILSLVPAIYLNEYEGLATEGNLILSGSVNGVYSATTLPSGNLKLQIKDGMFKYPDLPKSADNIEMDLVVFYDGVNFNNTTVDLNKFHIELAENPVDITLNVRTPESDMHVKGNINSNLVLSSILDVIPLEDIKLTGRIISDLSWNGYMSYIENEQYDKFDAAGSLMINGFEYTSPDFPQGFIISESSFAFTPKYVAVNKFDAKAGKSDIHLTGKIENFIPYVFHDETIKGDFSFSSGILDLNEFMTESEEEVVIEEETDTVSLTVFEVPSNINFRLVSRINSLYYDKLEIQDIYGLIKIMESRVILENLQMNMLDGSMNLSGEYNTRNTDNPLVDFNINASGIDIGMAFESFDIVKKIAPIAGKAAGDVSLGLKYKSLLDINMKPVVRSISGGGNLMSDQIGIKGSNTFSQLNNVLNTETFKDIVLNNVSIDFKIENGTLAVKPFETAMGKTKLKIGGEQGTDQTLNYDIDINAPRSVLGASNNAIDQLYSEVGAKGINIPKSENVGFKVKVTGTFTDPKISLGLKDQAADTKEVVKDAVKEKAKTEIKKTKTEVKSKANAEAEKILKEAEAKAELVRSNARKSAAMVRKQSDETADKIMSEAKNPVAKAAAKPLADKTRKEGEEKAQKIIKEADEKAEAILNEAREKANKLK